MADVVGRPSLGYTKSTSGVDFQIPINLEDTFRNAKPPVVPPLFQSICEEILARITSRQLSILPAPLSSLFANAEAMANNILNSAQVDEVIKMLHFGNKNLTEKQRILKRKSDLEPHRSSVLVRALFKYIQLCSGGIDLVVEFPSFGYLVTGPPPKEGGSFNLRAYTRSLELFLHNALDKTPIKRDIFCYFMRFLAEIYQWTSEAYRSEPALCVMTRHILASKFGPELFVLKCQSCDMRIDETNKGCEICLNVVKYIRPPYEAHIMSMMLEHSSSSYWKGMLSDPRPAIIGPMGERTKIEDLLFLRNMKSITRLGDLPPIPKIVNMTTGLTSHGSTVNNVVSFLKVPEKTPSDGKNSGDNAEAEVVGGGKDDAGTDDRRTTLISGVSGEHVFSEQRDSDKRESNGTQNQESIRKISAVSDASGGSRGRGILSAALNSTKDAHAPPSRSSLFKQDSVKSVKSEASEVTTASTTTSKAQKKSTPSQRRPRSRIRRKSKPRGSTASRKSRKKTRSGSKKRKKSGGGGGGKGREILVKGKKHKRTAAAAAAAKKKTPKGKQEQKKKKKGHAGGKNKRGKLKKR